MKRILITRPRLQAGSFAQQLKSAGFEPIYFPVIEIQPMQDHSRLDCALSSLNKYDWVIFTSVNAVDVVFERLGGSYLAAQPGSTRFAAIGPKTASALAGRGITPAFVPEEFVAEAIMPGLGNLCGKWVLLPRAEIARKVLPEAIAAAGGVAHEIAVYRTLPADPDPKGLEALRTGVDVVTLTSPSAVQNFVAILRANGLDASSLPGAPLFACIGPITEAAAKEEGLSNRVVAREYTTNGLVEILSNVAKED